MSDNCFIGQRIIKVDDTFWIISTNHNAIWKCNDSFEIVDYLIFEDEEEKDNLFRAIVCIEHVIYCFPFNFEVIPISSSSLLIQLEILLFLSFNSSSTLSRY